MSTTTARDRRRPARAQRTPQSREAMPKQRTPILTRAETAECTCPEACERDHERD